MPSYPFTEEQAATANKEWGANCGPIALAFALQTSLEAVRYALPDFASRGYTSPTMMAAALAELGRSFSPVRNPSGGCYGHRGEKVMFAGPMCLVRVQWTGPWTANGKRAKWAQTHTHWIATWAERSVPLVFDCNGGINGFSKWEDEIVPAIVATIPRADGGWFPSNVWRLAS